MRYRRTRYDGGTYFFTVVSYKRDRILCEKENVDLLRAAFRKVKDNHPFDIDAFVLLPDHLHCIWTLPRNDHDYSDRWRMIKGHFSREYRGKDNQLNGRVSDQKRMNERAVWQGRFWEHLIRDNDDFERHVAYIHYNPVKHGYVNAPKDWEYSSFRRYVQLGKLDKNWAGGEGLEFDSGMEWGVE